MNICLQEHSLDCLLADVCTYRGFEKSKVMNIRLQELNHQTLPYKRQGKIRDVVSRVQLVLCEDAVLLKVVIKV